MTIMVIKYELEDINKKFHEKRSADNPFFVEEPNKDKNEESEGAFFVGNDQRSLKQQHSRHSSSKEGSSSQHISKPQDALSIILQSPEQKKAYTDSTRSKRATSRWSWRNRSKMANDNDCIQV